MADGSPFDDCVLHERIGEGGIADVFRATWRGADAAVKVLRDPDRPGLRGRFLREGRLLGRLSHPGLVRCLHVYDDDQPALVLELLRGEDLEARVRRQRLSAEEAVRLAASMLRTLAFLHERGIVHRDVKSSNVYWAEGDRVVLMDLGLAADPADPLTTTLGDVLGTHAYMAPEQIAGAETDHRCDLYSLGITLYEALTGHRPYQARGLAGWLVAHRSGGATPVVELAPHAPVRLAALVDRLMARDPAARPASAAVALALLTGTPETRRELEEPPLVAREGLRGALAAVLETGGVLRVQGELGSGLGAAGRLALRLAGEEGVEYALVRSRVRAGLGDVVAALANELSAMVDRVPEDPDVVRDALAGLCAEGGRFLLLVEDFDLASAGVAAYVESLTDLPGLATVLIGGALPERPRGRDHHLRPLDATEVRKLVSGMLGTPDVPPGLDAALHGVCGGLPALIVAVLREQVERGAVWCDGATEEGLPRWAWDPSAPLAPGEEASRPFLRALDVLPAGTRRLLEVLAVAGAPVPLELLLHAAGADPSGLDLCPALRPGLVAVTVERGEEWVALRRAVMEPIVAAGVPEEERRRLHLALADGVRHRPQGEWERRFLLLHGALGAEDPGNTARLVEMGEWLVQGGRPVDALATLDAAARLPLEDPGAAALLALARGDALAALGRLVEARGALEVGRVAAEEAGRPALVERAVLALVEASQQLGIALPDDLATSLRRIAAADPPNARALLLAAEDRRRAGDLDAAGTLLDAAVAVSPPGPVDRIGVAARLARARLDTMRGAVEPAAVHLRAIAAELRALDRVQAACHALGMLAEVLIRAGSAALAVDTIRAAEDLARGRHLPWTVAGLGVRRAHLHLACGDLEGAAGLLRARAACGERAAPWLIRQAWLDALSELRAAQGDTPAELAVHLRAAEAAAVAGDELFRTFHAGMAAVLTADVAGVGEAVDGLQRFDAPRLVARLLLAGARAGRDRELLPPAAQHAREAGDRILLLAILSSDRGQGAREEARAICTDVLEGLYGPLRQAFLERTAVRWSLGEPPASRRDSSA